MTRKKGNPGCPCCDCGYSIDLPGGCDRVDEGTYGTPNSFRRITVFRVPPGEVIGIDTQDKYVAHFAYISAYQGNEPVYGMSSVDGKWKVYLRWDTVESFATQLKTYTARLWKVEDGGTPVEISGPYVLTTRWGGGSSLYVVCVYDETTNEISFSWFPPPWTTSNLTPFNPSTAYPSICVAERLQQDGAYVRMQCPYTGVFAGMGGASGWTARLCVCDGALTGSSPYWIQGKVPTGRKYSKWPAGIRATLAGVTSPWDVGGDYYYENPQNELNGDHDFGSLANDNQVLRSVCEHICRREIIIYQPIFSPVVVFTSILGLDLSLVSSYDSVADETTITMSGYIRTPGGYLSGAAYGLGYFSQAIVFSKVFPGDKDVRLLDDDLDLVAWGAGAWDFSSATLHLTTIHP